MTPTSLIFGGRGPRLAIPVIAAATLLSSGIPTTSHAQNYENWAGQYSSVCRGGIDGFRTRGAWGHQHSHSCRGADNNIATPEDGEWRGHISEEPPSNIITCPSGHMVTQFACGGDHCDRFSIKCAPVKLDGGKALHNHRWLPVGQSEEPPANEMYFPRETGDPNAVLTGARCEGAYCDNLFFQIATYGSAPVNVGRMVGYWHDAGSGGSSSTVSHEASISLTNSEESSWSTETRNALSSTIGSEMEFEGVGKITSSITSSVESAKSQARSMIATRNVGYKETCATNFEPEKYRFTNIWQWSVHSTINGERLEIRTCHFACTYGAEKPTKPYGDSSLNDSCLQPR